MLSIRRLSALSAGLLAAVAFASAPVSAQKSGGTLVQITQPEPPNLAPYISTSGPIGQVTAKVFDGLLEYGFDLKPVPSLAESFEVTPDGKTITFKLRKDVKFHDGKPFTSADVQFTFMEVLKKVHPRGIATFRELTAVETPDAHTAIFKLGRAAPYMLMAFSGYESPVLPKHVYGTGDIKTHANANMPVGSGPFRFVEWRRGEFVRLDKNKDYWRKGMPYLDRIVVRFIADSSTRTAALEKGEAHVAGFGAIPYNDVKKLTKLPSVEVTTKGYEMVSPIVELLLNTKHKPLDNQKVRQALAYAVDRQFVIDNVWFGFGKAAAGPISSNFEPSGLFGAGVDYTVPDRIERANKLLDEAGFPRKADANVTPGDIAGNNLVLFGTPEENRLLKRIADKLPVKFLDGGFEVGGKTYRDPEAGLLMVYPNPLNPERYVLLLPENYGDQKRMRALLDEQKALEERLRDGYERWENWT